LAKNHQFSGFAVFHCFIHHCWNCGEFHPPHGPRYTALLSACLAGQQWAQGLALLKNCQEETVQGAAAKVLDMKVVPSTEMVNFLGAVPHIQVHKW
jgi:hypothetical protein